MHVTDTKSHDMDSTQIGRKLYHLRKDVPSAEALKIWFGLFKEFVHLHMVKLENMWNMDEDGCCSGVTDNERIIGGTCTKCSHNKSPESRERVFCVEALSTEGKKKCCH